MLKNHPFFIGRIEDSTDQVNFFFKIYLKVREKLHLLKILENFIFLNQEIITKTLKKSKTLQTI